jgi:hypothetical protein
MKEINKDKLEELEILRERALFAPEEERDIAQRNYENLRDELICVDAGKDPEQTKQTKELSLEDRTLICESCGKPFTYLAADQQFYEGQGIEEPKVCLDCRRDQALDKSDIKGEGASGGNGGFNS